MAVFNWLSPVNHDWFNGPDWGGTSPGAGDTARIGNTGTTYVTITSAGAAAGYVEVTNAHQLDVIGAGTLTTSGYITAGGTSGTSTIFISGTLNTATAYAGYYPGGIGDIWVQAGGTLLATNIVYVGSDTNGGNGDLFIETAGTVTTSYVVVGNASGSIGHVMFGGHSNASFESTGTLYSGSVNLLNGGSSLEFHTNNASHYDGVISGLGQVLVWNDVGVVSTLNNAETYYGATEILGGTLALTGAGSIANSYLVNIQSAATFDISGAAGAINIHDLSTSGISFAPANVNLSGHILNITEERGIGYTNFSGGAGLDVLNITIASNVNDLDFSKATFTNWADASDTILINGNGLANVIAGTAQSDTIFGGAGNDTLYGGAGNDVIGGGAGSDIMDGGTGFNYLYYGDSSAGVTINLFAGTGSGGDAQGDIFANFQGVFGSAQADVVYGDNTTNYIDGGAGDDYLFGYGGNDTIIGGAGNDVIGGGAGADYMDGGAGNNTLYYVGSAAGVTINLFAGTGSGGDAQGDSFVNFQNIYLPNFDSTAYGDNTANTIVGGSGNDLLFGYGSNDVIVGGAGNDLIGGGAGADYMDGGTGFNTLYYADSSAAVTINFFAGTGTGGDAQGDTLLNFQGIIGSAFNDILIGDNNANYINGGAGNDFIVGYGGNDYLVGGAGNDLFAYTAAGFGHDEVADFTIGQDHFYIATSLVANFSALTLTASGANTIITIGGDSIQIDGLTPAQLHASDFIFY